MAEIADLLRRIVERRRRRLAEAEPADRGEGGASPTAGRVGEGTNPLAAALEARSGRAVIAEIKMGSPRLGSLEGRFDPRVQAEIYAARGAAAISVVVEPDFFHGSYELLEMCRRASGLPTLAKDFVVDDRQLLWAARAGADAVLLIAALHQPWRLTELAASARALGLAPLIETHDPADAAKLGGEEWELVGVNNRDLRTFEVDLERSLSLLPRLPSGSLKVSESGISTSDQVRRLAAAGFDAFLIGESLLLAEDPGETLRRLIG